MIAIVTLGVYPERTGGVEVHTFEHARILRRDGFEVIVLTKRRGGTKNPNEFGMERPLLGQAGFLLGSTLALWRIRRRLAAVHVHYATYFLIPAVIMNVFFAKPIVVSCHGFDVQYLRKSGVWRRLQKFAFSRATFVTGASKDVIRVLSGEYGVPSQKIRLVPNGVDWDEIARARSDAVPDPNRIVYLANLRPVKDPLTAVRAFEIVKRAKPALRLVVVGDGPMMPELRSLVSSGGVGGVELKGMLGHPEALREVATSGVFLLTSVSEGGNPLALMEAMAMGKAVVVSDVGGARDVIVDGVNGILAEPRSPESFARAIATLLDDDEMRSRLGAAAKVTAEGYSWDASIGSYERMYPQSGVGTRSGS